MQNDGGVGVTLDERKQKIENIKCLVGELANDVSVSIEASIEELENIVDYVEIELEGLRGQVDE